MKRKFFVNTVILTSASILLSTLRMYLRVFISEKIGPEGMGLYQLIITIFGLAITLSSAGMGITLTRLIAEADAKRQPHGPIVNRMAMLSVLTGVCVGLLLYSSASVVSAHILLDIRAVRSLRVLALAIPAISLSSCLRGYYIARKKIPLLASVMLGEQLLQITFSVYLIGRLQSRGIEYSCFGAMLANVCSESIACIFLLLVYLFTRQRKGHAGARTGGRRIFGQIAAILLPIALGAYIQSALGTAENVLIPARLRLFGGNSLSQYGLLKGMALPVLFFPAAFIGSFTTLLLPDLSKAYAKHRGGDAVCRIVRRVLEASMTLSILIGATFYFFGEELGYLLYKQQEIGVIIRMLAPLIPFMYLEGIIDSMLTALNQQTSTLRYTTYIAVLSVVSIYFLLPFTGSKGYIVVIYAGTLLSFALLYTRLLTVTKIRAEMLRWFFLPAACSVLSCLAVRILLPGRSPSLLHLVSAMLLACGIFAAAYLVGHLLFQNKKLSACRE